MAVAVTRPPLPWSRNACELELPQLVDEAREAFGAELAIPLAVERPPKITTRDGHDDVKVEIGEASLIGYSLSSQLHRLLGQPSSYGDAFPVARALDDLRGWCLGCHVEAPSGPWDDHLGDVGIGPLLQRPLCARLACYVIVWRATPAWAARQERLAVTHAARLLEGALRHAWEQRRMWAHAGGSGVPQVLAEMRRARRAARARAAETSDPSTGIVCRYCGGRYDPASVVPCPGSESNRMSADEVSAFDAAYPGVTLLCSPTRSASTRS